MNAKRQTIWLISMLSLMVVLSAYYLFTQDADPKTPLVDGTLAGDQTNADNGSIALSNNGLGGYALTDEEQAILDQYTKQGFNSTSVFSDIYNKRSEEIGAENDRLLSAISNTGTDAEASMTAMAELSQLDEREALYSEVINKLQEQYSQAVIDDTGNNYKVVVGAEQLDKKQAASIIQLVTEMLDVDATAVSVQYYP